MEVNIQRNSIRKNILISLVLLLCIPAFLFIYPSYKVNHETKHQYQTLFAGHANLKKIIEYQDMNYQTTGSYASITPNDDLSKIISNFQTCTTNCSKCEYASTVSKASFTATAKCPEKDNNPNFLGYVRAPLGAHTGIDGYYKKCRATGIYAGNRNLVNTIGPCFEQSNGVVLVVSGNKKRLAVETSPPNAIISINGKLIGKTSSSHNTISSNYGSFFWENPYKEISTIKISKQGYESVESILDWDDFTYSATAILRPLEN